MSKFTEGGESLETVPRSEGGGNCHPTLNVDTANTKKLTAKKLLTSLSILDRFLAILVFLAMIIGVIIGVYAPGVQKAFNGAKFAGTSVPLVIGMIVMMWPALTKVEYERLPALLKTKRLYYQILISLVLNWIIGPFVMLACAWIALPDLETYRTGIIMVGLARCIAMVMIWNHLAGGDNNLCAILVIVNSILQIILYSPFAVFFIEVISDADDIKLQYGTTAIAVLIFLGIPLGLGIITRFTLLFTIGRHNFHQNFLPYFSPFALAGLLYTIIIIFAQQAEHILHNIGPVFRTIVPLLLYFIVMFGGTFGGMWWWSNKKGEGRGWGYEEAAVQSFTAASNNFELSIAVCVAVFGADSDQALAATIGPLVEVPVLLALTWVAIYLGKRLKWGSAPSEGEDQSSSVTAVESASEEVKREGDGFDRGGTVDLV